MVVDVTDDGVIEQHRKRYLQRAGAVAAIIIGVLAALFVAAALFVRSSWYVGVNGDTVAIYRGVNSSILGHDLYALSETTTVQLADLPDATQANLRSGVVVNGEDEAHATIQSYQEQIESEKAHAQQVADKSTAGTETSLGNPAVPKPVEGGDEDASA